MRKCFYLSIFFIAAFLTSCTGFLEKEPFDKLEADTEEKVIRLLVNAYPSKYWGYITEMSSDESDVVLNISQQGDPMHRQFYSWQDTDSEGTDSPHSIWENYYHAIAHANLALETIQKLGEPESLIPYKGEALICRAYCHFILVNLFGKHYNKETSGTDLGIPYITAVEKTIGARYERRTVEEVYDKIEQDISEGLKLLDDTKYSVPKYHFNKKAAQAFASRFYLYKGDFEKVVEITSALVDEHTSSGLRDWKEFSMLEGYSRYRLYSEAGLDCNLMIGSFDTQWFSSSQNLLVYNPRNNFLIQKTEGILCPGLWGESPDAVYIEPRMAEYDGFVIVKTGVHPQNLKLTPLFTLEEVLLNRAEAYIRLSPEKGDGFLDLALEDIAAVVRSFSEREDLSREMVSEIYGHSMEYYEWNKPTPKKPLDPSLGISGEAEIFIHALLHLRRAVFIHEGFRWFDIKRYGIEIYRREIEGDNIIRYTDLLSGDDERRAFQLPQSSIAAGLKPNPR